MQDGEECKEMAKYQLGDLWTEAKVDELIQAMGRIPVCAYLTSHRITKHPRCRY